MTNPTKNNPKTNRKSDPYQNKKSVTITSYNIHKGMSALNRNVVVDGIAQGLKELASDIICLQEVQGKHLKRAVKFNKFPNQSQDEWFGKFLDYDHSYGKNSEYQHGHHGNAILSHSPLSQKQNVNVTVNKLEKRGVLHCELTPTGWDTSIIVLCAHLNLLEGGREKQYAVIKDYVNNQLDPNQPLILAGDFNDWRKNACDKLANQLNLQEAFISTHDKLLPTFPARLPVLSLDRIYVRNLTVKNAWVHKGKPWSKLSDHLPVSAEVELL